MKLKFASKKVRAFYDECERLKPLGKRLCSKCGVQPISLFQRDAKKPDGLNLNCRMCQTQAWRSRTGKPLLSSEQLLEYKDALLGETSTHGYCTCCKQSLPLETHFKHREKYDRNRISAKENGWYSVCSSCQPKKFNESRNKRAIRGTRQRAAIKCRKWAQRVITTHRDKGIIVTVTINDLLNLIDENGHGVCYYTCDEVIIGYNASVDRKESGPLSVDNMCLCSTHCNSTKTTMAEKEFKDYLKDQPEAMQRIRRNNRLKLKSYYASFIGLDELKRLARNNGCDY